jgi:MFS family permease
MKLFLSLFIGLEYLQQGKVKRTNIKLDIGLSGLQLTFLTGTVFTVVSSVCGLASGQLADTQNRKHILMISTSLWTFCTFLSIACTSFWQLLLSRIGFAVFMSACVPSSVSLITDYYDHHQLGRANSIFAFGVYLGVGLSSLTILIDDHMGWVNALCLISGICFVFAALTVFLKEPRTDKNYPKKETHHT